jgi:hypothetical protein
MEVLHELYKCIILPKVCNSNYNGALCFTITIYTASIGIWHKHNWVLNNFCFDLEEISTGTYFLQT